MKKKVFVISTTHWDREWYQPFEVYRYRLVRMFDRLLELLENDSEYAYFHLDGQTVPLEDYLQIRRENEGRVRDLIEKGRLVVGPWYTMPDEFLVSGDFLVRNLQKGHEKSAAFGGKADKSGYVCDIFGHCGQLPQILKGFGIRDAYLFRGRKGYEKNEFLWRGADGSETTVHKMHPDYAYSSFYFVVRWSAEGKPFDYPAAAERMKAFLAEEEKEMTSDALVMFDGVDHSDAAENLSEILRYFNRHIEGWEFIHGGLSDYNAYVRENAKIENIAAGNLYELAEKGVNNSLLKNVLSSVLPIKQANARLENRIAKISEPAEVFASLYGGVKTGHEGYFRHVEELMLMNEAHDSICGCSVDATIADVLSRYKNAEECLGMTEGETLKILASLIKTDVGKHDGAFTAFNFSAARISGGVLVSFEIPCEKDTGQYRIYDSSGKLEYCKVKTERINGIDDSYGKLVSFPQKNRVTIALCAEIDAFSYKTFYYDTIAQYTDHDSGVWKFIRYDEPERYGGSMRLRENVIDNGKLIVEVNANGTLAITVKETGRRYEELLYLEDGGDEGDGWNYVKPFPDAVTESLSTSSRVTYLSDTPAVIRFRVDKEIRGADGSPVAFVGLTVNVYRDDTRLDIEAETDNKKASHRLRACLPLSLAADSFYTALPFDMCRWKVGREDDRHTKEAETGVVPMQGAFLIREGDNCVGVYTKGLYEIAVEDRADRAVKLTLLRSFSHGPAGFTCEYGKALGISKAEFAVDFAKASPYETLINAEAYRTGLLSLSRGKGTSLPADGRLWKIDGKAVVSSLLPAGENVVLRLYDAEEGTKGEISFLKKIKAAYVSDFEGNRLSDAEVKNGSLHYELKSKEIKQFVLKF